MLSVNETAEMNGKDDKRLARWERFQRMWYNFYLFLGVGINFIIYFIKPFGFDPGQSLLWGTLIGAGIPLSTMMIGTTIHKKVLRI
jgi:hypothetical protein